MTGTAAIYCRISQDATEEGLGVAQQEGDCRKLALKHGLKVLEPAFIDNDTGASDLSKKPRPRYAEMLQAVEEGRVTHILAYSNSRLTRRLRELEDLIQLHERTGVQIFTVMSGNDDLSTEDGKMVARIKASVDAAEAGRTGERVRRAARRNAELGRVKKGRYRTFGYTDDFQVVEEEAAIIRDAFQRVINGESLQSIARLWSETGVALGNGKGIYHSTVSNIVRRPLYAGLSVYKGEVVGEAQVVPIVAVGTFHAAQAVLQDSSRPRGKNARRYLLSGYLFCGLCFSPLQGSSGYSSATKGKLHSYRCSTAIKGCGKQAIGGVGVETLVLSLVRRKLILGPEETKPVTDYSTRKAELERDRQTITANTSLSASDKIDLITVIREELNAIEREETKQALEAAEERSAFANWDEFVAGSLSQQKATVGRYVSRVIVMPAKGSRWDPSRVTVLDGAGSELNGENITPDHLDPRVIVDGFRQDKSLIATKGKAPKKSKPFKSPDGKFAGSKKAGS